MELRQIRFFVAVAEDLHFGRAAERMYIAQPALSQHIRRLERLVGVCLFDRSGRHVRLTPAGIAFLESSRRILDHAEEASRRARRAEAGESGTVTIGVDIGTAGPFLAEALRCWTTRRPDVRPVLVSARRPQLLDLMRRHELDVAVLDGPVVEAGLETALLLEHTAQVLVADRDVLAGQVAPVCIGDLRDRDFVFVDRALAPGKYDRTIAMCDAAGFSPRIAVEVDDVALVPLTVASCAGVAVVGANIVAGHLDSGVHTVPLAANESLCSLVAVSAEQGATRQASEFVESLVTFTTARRASDGVLSAVG